MPLDHLAALVQSPDPQPFQELQATLAELDTVMIRAAAMVAEDEREMLVEKLRDGQIPPARLVFDLSDGDYSWAFFQPAGAAPAAIPAYYEWKLAMERLQQASQTLQDYAGLLARLASPKTLSPAEVAAMEKRLDALVLSGLNVGTVLEPQSNRKAAAGLVSLAAADLFRLVIRHHGRESLQQAREANAPVFHAYLETLRILVRELHRGLRFHYAADADALVGAWESARPAPETKAKRLVALNENLLARLKTLQQIDALLDTLAATATAE